MTRLRSRLLAFGLLTASLLGTACQRGAYQPKAQLGPTAQPVGATQPADPQVEALVAPYRQKVKQQMDEVIGTAPVALTKNAGESPLANFVADLIRTRAARETGKPVDLGVMPNGSLRAPLPAGTLTVGSVFELMPFENEVVVLQAPGPVVQQLFEYAAKIKMALSGATYTATADGKPTNIRLAGEVFDPNKEQLYTIAITDYHAGGGDQLTFLKPLPPQRTNVLVRTAIQDHIRQLTKEGKPVTAQNEGRVKF